MKPWLALVGIGKQTAKGAALGTAAYGFGITDGNVHKLDVDQETIEITSTSRLARDVIRKGAIPGAEFTTHCFAKPMPLLLYGVLGTIATSGPVSTVYTHTLTPGQTLPYLTLFGRQDGEYVSVRDCRVSSLAIKWDGASPPEVECEIMGLVPTYGTAWTITTDVTTDSFIPTGGGSFKVQGLGTAVAEARVKGGEVKFMNTGKPTMLSKTIVPDEINEGKVDWTCSLTMVPTTDLSDWKKIITGGASGTSVSETPIYGALNLKFVLDANTDLEIDCKSVVFLADWPDADPSSGEEIELVLEGTVLQRSAGDVSVKVRNTIVSY